MTTPVRSPPDTSNVAMDTMRDQPRQPTGSPDSASETEESKEAQKKQAQERANYASICRLMVELAPVALRQVFNGVHPPLHLPTALLKPQTHATLKRLKSYKVISEKKWDVLFPQRKTRASSENYDAVLLSTLLKTICHLSPPYPNGWTGVPLHSDRSMGADLIRIQWFRTLLATLEEDILEQKDYRAYWKQITEVLERLGGTTCKIRADRIGREGVKDPQMQNGYIELLKEWDSVAKDIEAAEVKAETHHHQNKDADMSTAGVKLPALDSPDEGTEMEGLSQKHRGTKGKGMTRSVSCNSVAKGASADMGAFNMKPEELRLHERAVLLQFFKQLTENVNSDDVVSKLIQRGVLSHEEKNRINLAPRNSDRMKLVIEMIPKKANIRAFDKFCDVIKYKYTTLYDQLIKAKQAPFSLEKPDESTLCCTALRVNYDDFLSKCHPLPWYPDMSVPLQDHVLPWCITDYAGRDLTPENLFIPHPKCERPKRLLLEGASGSGKTTFCNYLALQWSQKAITFRGRFKLIFSINMQLATGDLVETVQQQCLSHGFDRAHSEINTLLQMNQQHVLFILDGFENLPQVDSDIYELIHKRLYPKSSVLLTVNSNFVTPQLRKFFDTRLVLCGLVKDSQEELVKKYAELTHHPLEIYASLLAKVIHEYETSVRLLSLNPLYCLCMCLIVETGGNLEFSTVTSLLQGFVTALQKNFCKANLLQMTEDCIPDEIQIMMTTLESKAYQTLANQRTTFTAEELGTEFKKKMEAWFNIKQQDLFRFGLIQTRTQIIGHKVVEMCSFASRVVHEFMAARFLSQLEHEDFLQYKDLLMEELHMQNVLPFYLGIQRSAEYNDPKINAIAQWLATLNTDKCRAQALVESRAASTATMIMEPKVGKMEGKLSDFKLCLESIQQSEGRKDLLDVVVESLPCRLFMRHKDMYSLQMISGLAVVIRSDNPRVTELEIRLDHFGLYYDNMFLKLADSIEKSNHLISLKLKWTDEDFLALFLANVFGKNLSVENLQMVDDSRCDQNQISATLWSNLRSAGLSMLCLKSLAFTQCSNPALVSSVIRHCPEGIEALYLNGCSIDLVGAQELAGKVEKAKTLNTLGLSGTKLNRADFLNVTLGIRLNRSLTELQVCDMNLDNASMAALTEALKFNGTLQKLNLSFNSLSELSCKMLGYALSANNNLREVQLTDCDLTEDSVRVLRSLKNEKLSLTGLDRRRKLSALQLFGGNNTISLPLLPIKQQPTQVMVED